ncbi:MAG: GNAT family N-acetyltransferase [Candidatus Pelagibacter bacterium]|nr:GNAT family N-acetyltransferase [Candidatus Pelagibacter bacterium]
MTIEVQRYYLNINSIKDLSEIAKPSDIYQISLVNPPDFQLNKFFYKQIGQKYRWIDRLIWNEKKWIEYVNNSDVKTFILKEKNNLAGYFEQIFHKKKLDCEIAYFGILEDYFGNKLGGYLLSEAIKKSFRFGAKRAWVHTCSMDHKYALKNYLSRGMKIFKTEVLNIN